MNNFDINSNFRLSGFENSINDFNKTFSSSLDNANSALNGSDFEKIFNSQTSTVNTKEPLKGNAQYYIGLDSINAQKIENMSPSEKLLNDIGKGFSNSINELSSIDKKAQDDFETFAAGGDISVHEVMISAQKSNLAMQMAIQLRNQMLNAYNEFKNMSV